MAAETTSQKCHTCRREAVGRCFTCGNLFCADHGHENCVHCQTGIIAGDFRADRITARPPAATSRPGWWRPQVADDFEPPACHICQGLARLVCRNCQNLYCREHAGAAGLCRQCYRSSCIGLYIFAIMVGLLVLWSLISYWSGP